ncbi:MAG: hypothetical protein H0X35_09500 [Pseudonocardiales bacterium]|nr:hypothetical protein [Pseudonocardiales bacterium]
MRDNLVLHHIVDPVTGQPVEPVLRTASVAAPSTALATRATRSHARAHLALRAVALFPTRRNRTVSTTARTSPAGPHGR